MYKIWISDRIAFAFISEYCKKQLKPRTTGKLQSILKKKTKNKLLECIADCYVVVFIRSSTAIRSDSRSRFLRVRRAEEKQVRRKWASEARRLYSRVCSQGRFIASSSSNTNTKTPSNVGWPYASHQLSWEWQKELNPHRRSILYVFVFYGVHDFKWKKKHIWNNVFYFICCKQNTFREFIN